jgi:hypothetical protein
MATRHPHPAAVRLAGELYGRILNRNSDEAGFAYILDSLKEGKKSVRQHALELIESDEFRTSFVANSNGRAVVEVLHRILLGRPIAEPGVAAELQAYARLGLKGYAERLTKSGDYAARYGEDGVPGIGH